MTFIPSNNLMHELEGARVGVWLDPLVDGRIALACKIPESIIKAIHRGDECSLLAAVIEVERVAIICLGLRVKDEPDNPFTVINPLVSSRDLALLKIVLATGSTTLHCINELNQSIAGADCSLEKTASRNALDDLNSTNPYILSVISNDMVDLSEMFQKVETAMNHFQMEAYRVTNEPASKFIKSTARIPLTLSPWEPIEVFEVSPTLSSGPFRIDDEDEGGKQEKGVYQLADLIYPGNTYTSPKIKHGSLARELIDVLGLGNDSICLFESKAIAIITSTSNNPSGKRASRVEKQIIKGLNQLEGALTKLRSDVQIYNEAGQPLVLPGRSSLPAHAIVLLSEMYAFLDWQQLARDVIARSQNEQHMALFQVMDLSELAYLVRAAKTPTSFNTFLVQRWMGMNEKGTANLRVKLPYEADKD